MQLGSGFDVELIYARNVRVPGEIIGLNDDYDLTAPLARFLELNQDLISVMLPGLDKTISAYRHHRRKECRWKAQVLTYRFLSYVFDQPRDPGGLVNSFIDFERDLRVRELMVGSEAVLQAAYERLTVVSSSEAATWWYIFWVCETIMALVCLAHFIRMTCGGETTTQSPALSFMPRTSIHISEPPSHIHHFRVPP